MDMIKENKDFFLYVLGIIGAFIVLLLVLDFATLGSFSEGNCGVLGFKCWLNKIMYGDKIYSEPPAFTIDTNNDYRALVKTNYGDFEIDLYEKNAPVTVNNFVFLANEDYYDGVKFHRIARGFLIQGGDRNTLDLNPENDGEGGPGYMIDDEINWDSLDLSNAKRQQLSNLGYSSDSEVTSRHLEQASVAMANNEPNSNGSQFFIVTGSSDDTVIKGLEGRHTVFGTIISGWDVVLAIEEVEVDDPTSNSPRPLEDIIINDIEIKVL